MCNSLTKKQSQMGWRAIKIKQLINHTAIYLYSEDIVWKRWHCRIQYMYILTERVLIFFLHQVMLIEPKLISSQISYFFLGVDQYIMF